MLRVTSCVKSLIVCFAKSSARFMDSSYAFKLSISALATIKTPVEPSTCASNDSSVTIYCSSYQRVASSSSFLLWSSASVGAALWLICFHCAAAEKLSWERRAPLTNLQARLADPLPRLRLYQPLLPQHHTLQKLPTVTASRTQSAGYPSFILLTTVRIFVARASNYYMNYGRGECLARKELQETDWQKILACLQLIYTGGALRG